jgi:hypothetical protein
MRLAPSNRRQRGHMHVLRGRGGVDKGLVISVAGGQCSDRRCDVTRARRGHQRVVVIGNLVHRQRDLFSTTGFRKNETVALMNGYPTAQVWQCEGGLPVATICGADQIEKCVVFGDRQQSPIAQGPSRRGKISGEHANLADIRLCHNALQALRPASIGGIDQTGGGCAKGEDPCEAAPLPEAGANIGAAGNWRKTNMALQHNLRQDHPAQTSTPLSTSDQGRNL